MVANSRQTGSRRWSKWRSTSFALALTLAASVPVLAQSANTAHTLKLDDPSKPAQATLADLTWMIGSWEAQAFGGTAKEHWLPGFAGVMTGVFELAHEDTPSMYEFMMVVPEGESVTLKLKHFNRDFSGWEEKADYVSFPLVKLTDETAYFDGMTYRKIGADGLRVYVSVGEEKNEEEIEFSRVAMGTGHGEHSPYAGLEAREIKALAPERVAGLLAGEGLGFAMPAELNGYPGPKHVLELAEPLALTPGQIEATREVFSKMRTAAVELGEAVVERELELDRLFQGKQATAETLQATSSEISALTGRLRAVHLSAHLAMMDILTPHQRHRYEVLRGYDARGSHGDHHPSMH